MYEIKYAKVESLQLLPMMYYDIRVVCLSRKRLKIEEALAVGKVKNWQNNARVAKWYTSTLEVVCRKAWRFESSPAH